MMDIDFATVITIAVLLLPFIRFRFRFLFASIDHTQYGEIRLMRCNAVHYHNNQSSKKTMLVDCMLVVCSEQSFIVRS